MLRKTKQIRLDCRDTAPLTSHATGRYLKSQIERAGKIAGISHRQFDIRIKIATKVSAKITLQIAYVNSPLY